MTERDGGTGHSRLFTLRIWTEPVENGIEHRGSVRDAATGAFCNFREWSGLTAFLVAQLEEGRSIREDC